MAAEALPDAALDDRLAFVGTSGSGKTYAAGTAVERLLATKARTVIVDPLGVWWGLRLRADGITPSVFPVVIFGGEHGDLPLNEHAGAIVGETVAGMAESCIVSLDGLGTKSAERRFMLAFLETLYRKATGEPFHIVFDEADLWAPQKTSEPMLQNLMEQIVRRGRVKGFIPWLITQRPAVLSKDVLSQADGLVAMKLTSSQDRDALGGWIEGQADRAEEKRILASLPQMERGHGIVWIPGRGVLTEVAFPTKATFDSSRTPKRGEKRQTRELKPIDLGALKDRLAKVEQEAKANDPKTLKAEIAALKRSLVQMENAARAAVKTSAPDPAAIEAAEKRGYERGLTEGEERGRNEGWAKAWLSVEAIAHDAPEIRHGRRLVISRDDAGHTAVEIERAGNTAPAPVKRPAPIAVPRQAMATIARQPTAPRPNGDSGVTGVQQRILDAVAEMEALCLKAPPRILVAIMANYSNVASTGFAKAMSGLSAAGHVSYPSPGTVTLTETGRVLAASVTAPATSVEVQDRVKAMLGGKAAQIVSELIAVYPDSIERQQLAERTGYTHVASTGFAKALSRLSSLGFVDYPSPRQARANEVLFP